ncbi:permease-like cell division protein FtsX [Reinekea sp. G2M2-21]|uniref:permease-like cell division protein FtsX n=1 Tax=Reinekea sp. G2M2-21 TaxID=2788942 RepID=UPI0018AAEE1E|nr:permease-like cell division protein FtsX [Reinekea sp. G2M2-21]
MAKNRAATNRRRNRAPKVDIKGWYRHHLMCARSALMGLIRQPISSALTWLVIAIALLLPTLFYIALQAINTQTQAWQEGGQITLYLNNTTTIDQGQALANELRARPEVSTVEYISKQQAWDSFRSVLSLQSALELDENPLPASIVVVPIEQSMADLEALILMLTDLADVEDIQIDLAWIERLNNVLDLIESIVQVLSIILATAVLLIVGNTIRLSIESRKAEIQIIKLLGATDNYVRRPFLYLGFWYGLSGGLAAWLLLTLISLNFQNQLDTFLASYGLTAPAIWLNVREFGILLLSSILVSLMGARIALWRHLKDTDPQ